MDPRKSPRGIRDEFDKADQVFQTFKTHTYVHNKNIESYGEALLVIENNMIQYKT